VGATQPAIDSDGDHRCRDGGVAHVNPPQRPGATLWSIAAGPLVNVALLPIHVAAVVMSRSLGWVQVMPDVYQLLRAVLWIDVSLLVFNMLPIYPLDGGQILRSLLWFVLGRARNLMVATPVYASPCTSRCTTQNSGPSGSLLLSRRTLAFPASCRFNPTHILGDFA
jgi:hypothetical protein